MNDPRAELVDALIALTDADLRAVRVGKNDLSASEAPRQALLDRLVALDRTLGPAADPALRERLQRLLDLNSALTAELGRTLGQAQDKLLGVARGRRGLSGYLGTARGVTPGAKLGRG